MIDREFIRWLEANKESIPTPLYIYSEAALDASYAELKSLFPEGVRVLYSLKANPQVGVVSHISRLGAGCEIASVG